jgi:nucleoside-diphosphate-sugar epimerase
MNAGKKKIMVGGGAGYIGSVLIPELIKLGHEVTVVDLLWFGNHLPASVTVVKKDLFNLTTEDLAGFEIFIFLAGLSNDPMAEFNPAKNFIYNAALPAYLAYLSKQAGVQRYIYASSCSIYGFTENELRDEDDQVMCDYPYGISKLQGESGVLQIQDDTFSVIALRQGTVCGFSPRMRFDLIINTMFKVAMTEGKVVINNPAIWRPIADIRDIATAYIKAVEADKSINGVFNITSGNFTVGEVGTAVQAELTKLTGKNIYIETKNIQDRRNYKVSIKKATDVLAFKPVFSIPDTINNLFHNLANYPNFEKEEFYNIRVFKNIDFF